MIGTQEVMLISIIVNRLRIFMKNPGPHGQIMVIICSNERQAHSHPLSRLYMFNVLQNGFMGCLLAAAPVLRPVLRRRTCPKSSHSRRRSGGCLCSLLPAQGQPCMAH